MYCSVLPQMQCCFAVGLLVCVLPPVVLRLLHAKVTGQQRS